MEAGLLLIAEAGRHGGAQEVQGEFKIVGVSVRGSTRNLSKVAAAATRGESGGAERLNIFLTVAGTEAPSYCVSSMPGTGYQGLSRNMIARPKTEISSEHFGKPFLLKLEMKMVGMRTPSREKSNGVGLDLHVGQGLTAFCNSRNFLFREKKERAR